MNLLSFYVQNWEFVSVFTRAQDLLLPPHFQIPQSYKCEIICQSISASLINSSRALSSLPHKNQSFAAFFLYGGNAQKLQIEKGANAGK